MKKHRGSGKSFVVAWSQNGKEYQRQATGKHQLAVALNDAWLNGGKKRVVVMLR